MGVARELSGATDTHSNGIYTIMNDQPPLPALDGQSKGALRWRIACAEQSWLCDRGGVGSTLYARMPLRTRRRRGPYAARSGPSCTPPSPVCTLAGKPS
jgi:hypothetical protein